MTDSNKLTRVTGVGGIFIKGKDADSLAAWYARHLGIPMSSWGGAVFRWQEPDAPPTTGVTSFTVFKGDTDYFGAGPSPYMINFRVADVRALVAALRAEGCQVDEKVEESEYGKFGWVTDPEGNRIELWEPPQGS